MNMLDRKLLRDIRRLWAQALAIALVIGGGAASLLLGVGSQRSLDETRVAYYERYRFADVFAVVARAPKTLVDLDQRLDGRGVIRYKGMQLFKILISLWQFIKPDADETRFA